MGAAFQKYSQYIKEMELIERNRKWCIVNSKLKSTELMTKLRHRFDTGRIDELCEDPYDVLVATFRTKLSNCIWLHISLVILYDIPRAIIQELDKEYYSNWKSVEHGKINNIVFHRFKKSRISEWNAIDKERRSETIQYGDEYNLHLWNRPFVLEASTMYDKDFRKIWRNGELEYEGNNYGDTSDFYIIGSLEKIKKLNDTSY